MPHRTASRASSLAPAALLAALLLAAPGCATSDGTGPAPDVSDRPALPATGVRVGWVDFKVADKPGRLTSLTLVSEGTEEGRLIAAGRARMDGGKVVDDATAAELILAYEHAGFDRFAVLRMPNDPPPGARAAVWIDRGNGIESLFFMPGARSNPETRDLPDVYDALKKLIFSVHQATPGSVVTSGQGWSGDDMLNQKPGGRDR